MSIVFPSARCYRVQAGKLTSARIPADGLELSVPDYLGAELPRALPSTPESVFWRLGTLDAVADIARRLTPWAVWFFAPDFSGWHLAGTNRVGEAHCYPGVGLVRSSLREDMAVSAAYHEAWHLAEEYLSADELGAVTAAVERGPAWGEYYLADPCERRARAFEAWAMSRHEAPAATREGVIGRALDALAGRLAPPHERVFSAVMSGRVGRRAAARRWIPKARLSPEMAIAAKSAHK